MVDLNQSSEALLLSVKLSHSTEDELHKLANLNPLNFKSLKTDDEIIAFWINIYNAFYQILAEQYPNAGKKIFSLKRINLANQSYSLDDIEHGILRMGKHKYSLGFLNSIGKYWRVKKYRPTKLDFRIHFALNCGAVSCPPIAFYSAMGLYEELDQATISFLESEIIIDDASKTVTLSRLFLWFYNDFGRKKGIRYIIRRYLNKKIKGYQYKFADYNWTTSLQNFK